jgi:hypothetical protein
MSHTYADEESGIFFHHNPDMGGMVTIVIPPGAAGEGTEITIPGEALERFHKLRHGGEHDGALEIERLTTSVDEFATELERYQKRGGFLEQRLAIILQGLRAVEDAFLGEELSEFLEYAAVPTEPFFEAQGILAAAAKEGE